MLNTTAAQGVPNDLRKCASELTEGFIIKCPLSVLFVASCEPLELEYRPTCAQIAIF